MSPKINIVQAENDILRTPAEPLRKEEISAGWVAAVIEDMKESLATTSDGVGIAAPQIGQPYRIFVVSGHVYNQLEQDEDDSPEEKHSKETMGDRVFINPEIIKTSKEKVYLDEGCLSVRNYFGSVPRHTKVTIQAYDEDGNKFIEGRSGLLAQIFQHEIDHLNGILFIDKAKDVVYREPKDETQ